jgi:hypothetical protein
MYTSDIVLEGVTHGLAVSMGIWWMARLFGWIYSVIINSMCVF